MSAILTSAQDCYLSSCCFLLLTCSAPFAFAPIVSFLTLSQSQTCHQKVKKALQTPNALLLCRDSNKLLTQQFSLQYLPATWPIYQALSAACPGPALHMLLQCKACSLSPEESVWNDLRAFESVGCYFQGGSRVWLRSRQNCGASTSKQANFH